MANSSTQLDKGNLRRHICLIEKRYYKKQRKRKLRQEAKSLNKPNPLYNRYKGGYAV